MKKVLYSLSVIAFVVVMNTNFSAKVDKSLISNIEFSTEQANADIQPGVWCITDPIGWGISHPRECSTCENINWVWLWEHESTCTPK